jgi:hypothetical protein
VIEASTDREGVARCLEALGHEVVVADPNFATMFGMAMSLNNLGRAVARCAFKATTAGPQRFARKACNCPGIWDTRGESRGLSTAWAMSRGRGASGRSAPSRPPRTRCPGRATLDDEALASARHTGRAMTLEHVLAAAASDTPGDAIG